MRAGGQARGNRAAQALGDRPGAMRLPEILTQIHDLDRRHGAVVDAGIEAQQLVLALATRAGRISSDGVAEASKATAPSSLARIDGYVAAVVARRFFLLVAGFLLLVDDDETEIF